MTYMTIEHAARYSWTAIEEKELPYGVLRFAHGYTRRANSMTVFGNTLIDSQELVDQCESFFSCHRQKAIFRIPPCLAAGKFDSFLDEGGYEIVGSSRVMSCVLEKRSSLQINILNLNIKDWLDSFCEISTEDLAQREVHMQLLQRIKGRPYFACLENEAGEPICCAIAILFNGVVGIHNVATSSAYKRRQLATGLLNALLVWGKENHATHAFLQVNQSNTAAINLYTKMGFRTLYRYWYREKDILTSLVRLPCFTGLRRETR